MIQTNSTTHYLPIIHTGQSIESQKFSIVFNLGGTKNIIGIDAYIRAYLPTSGTTINDGVWHSVLVTYDGVTLRIYVDGRLDNAATDWNHGPGSIRTTLNTQGNNIYLGTAWVGHLFSGSLKNVNFYNYALIISDPTIPTTGPALLFSSGLEIYKSIVHNFTLFQSCFCALIYHNSISDYTYRQHYLYVRWCQ